MPSLIVPIIGDSNAGFGGVRLSSDNDTNPMIWMLDRSTLGSTPAIVAASELLLEDSSRGNTMGGVVTTVGSSLALIKLLVERNKVPAGYDKIILVGTAWAGTAMVNYWAVTGNRYALDGGGGLTYGFYAMVNAALGLDPANRIWFYDWAGFGANCSGDSNFQSEVAAMFAEMRSTLRTGASAPVIVTPSPPDRATIGLGGATGLSAITAIQANCADWLPNSYYVSAVGLPSEMGNNQPFIHYSAASARGGVDNSATTNTNYTSGTWFWDASETYAINNFVLGSDNFCYKSKVNGNINHDPVTDGEVNWTKTTYQYGTTILNPLSERKYSKIVDSPMLYEFSSSW